MRKAAIETAYRQFQSTGDFSMRHLALSIGISAPALYHHFANKQQLLDHVADQAFAMFGSRLRAIDGVEPQEVVRRILREYREFARDEPNLFGLMFVDPRPSARRFPRDFADHRSAVFNALWKAADQCLTERPTRPRDDALYLAHDLWALTHGQILLWRAGRFENDDTFERVLDRSIDHFISML